ncbi:hypothetical protein QAD02_006895 [Eretmocerus hayati]|uniref:Uncharacterized protein n=1 Tax=Eretmocerus hayati TaxID=131215 RepID=A0ACC2N2L2_9HYME|nr:hypothetical protein QAD02_006895 [Eretmocerus hayati]
MMLPGTSEVTPGTTAPATVPPPTQDIAPASSVTPDSSAPAIMAESPALTRRYNREKVVTPAARLPKAELSTKVKRTTRSTFAVDLQKLRGRKPTPARIKTTIGKEDSSSKECGSAEQRRKGATGALENGWKGTRKMP